ncbi:mechanosensitive ion channel family protein [Alteromonas sp. 1_MG-2023]|uniref:mechanosensitive ion channel family protein n=1 Tax=Alteromonas sp. 1_MG-2023 TaxID=3062669 RepID=UPI0026E1B9A5|nr:mechanosensitive ion channel family protein [Alteromonas sp. 1_MG-2023]MDO6568964.1 mechanosensitive ion channel family protein [Alteromonas sp. 1_MG-2023]
MDTVVAFLVPFIPLVLAIFVVVVVLATLHYALLARNAHLTSEQKLPRQVTLLVLTIMGLVAISMALPVNESTRNQVIALIGVLLSGVIAFSSTTMVGNLMAGLVLRVNKPFKVGDFIRVEDYSGRVAEMGLLDTEIQTETRELIAFSNTLMVNTPVRVTRGSGAIISVDLSLGYDLHHSVVEKHLLTAAANAELEDPFVQVISLGDFSVSYRVAGLLKEVKSMLSARSRLHKSVLDALHNTGIEIVSPTFMNQRPQPDGLQMIPQQASNTEEAAKPQDEEESNPEAIIFDKAEEAEQHEKNREGLAEQIEAISTQLETAHGEEKDQLKTHKATLEKRLADLVEQHRDV